MSAAAARVWPKAAALSLRALCTCGGEPARGTTKLLPASARELPCKALGLPPVAAAVAFARLCTSKLRLRGLEWLARPPSLTAPALCRDLPRPDSDGRSWPAVRLDWLRTVPRGLSCSSDGCCCWAVMLPAAPRSAATLMLWLLRALAGCPAPPEPRAATNDDALLSAPPPSSSAPRLRLPDASAPPPACGNPSAAVGLALVRGLRRMPSTPPRARTSQLSQLRRRLSRLLAKLPLMPCMPAAGAHMSPLTFSRRPRRLMLSAWYSSRGLSRPLCAQWQHTSRREHRSRGDKVSARKAAWCASHTPSHLSRK
jgi:hypothetical protein